MKSQTFLNVIALSAYSSAAVIRPRDGPAQPLGAGLLSLLGQMPQVQKAMKVEQIKPVIDPQAKRIKITYGPYRIKAANDTSRVGNGVSMDPHGTGYSYSAGDDIPRDVTVLETKSEMVNEKFQRTDLAEGLYNHHNVFFDLSYKTTPFLQCNGAPRASLPMAVFMAGATEVTTLRYAAKDSNFKSGFYVGKNDKINIMVDMVNYKNTERTVYSVSEIEYLPGKAQGLLPAEQATIDIGTCDSQLGTNVHAPKGQKKFTLQGTEIKIAQDGYLANFRGHLHDGGKDMIIKLNDKEVCHSKAVYGGPGHEGVGFDGKAWATVAETTMCENSAIKVSKGDKLTIQARFDTDAHPQRESSHGEMAESMALFTGTYVSAKPI